MHSMIKVEKKPLKNKGLFKFPNKDAMQKLLNCDLTKSNILQTWWDPHASQTRSQVTGNTYVCKLHFNITDINAGFGRHRKIIKAKYSSITHYVKSVQIRSFFWSVFSRIRTEYGKILRISPYSVRIQENTDQKKLVFGHFSRSDCLPSRRNHQRINQNKDLLEDATLALNL